MVEPLNYLDMIGQRWPITDPVHTRLAVMEIKSAIDSGITKSDFEEAGIDIFRTLSRVVTACRKQGVVVPYTIMKFMEEEQDE